MKKLKKFLIAGAAVITMAVSLSGCNMSIVDTTYSFERVMIAMPDGTVVEGECESWIDFENSDMIQVTVDGKVYMTHSSNVVLISD